MFTITCGAYYLITIDFAANTTTMIVEYTVVKANLNAVLVKDSAGTVFR